MIWLAWRRHRVLLAIFAGLALALGVWMVLDAGSFSTAQNVCRTLTYQCRFQYSPTSIEEQAVAIDFLLLALPCLAGVLFGSSLVANDLEHDTNRLVWTQGVSRTKWLFGNWVVAAVPVVAITVAVTFVAQWWSGRVFVRLPLDLTLGDRIQPNVFSATGVVPVAYTLFALALGVLLGSLLHRSSRAGVALVILYTVLALVMAIFVRPALASQSFFSETTSNSQQYVTLPSPDPWNLGYRYRFIPGTTSAADVNLVAIVDDCRAAHPTGSPGGNAAIGRCLARNDVQGGFFLQPANHYWNLQWAEAGIYLGGALVLLGLTRWRVRRFSV